MVEWVTVIVRISSGTSVRVAMHRYEKRENERLSARDNLTFTTAPFEGRETALVGRDDR